MYKMPQRGAWGDDLDVPIGHELELFWISDHMLGDNTHFDAHFKVEVRPAGCGGTGTDPAYGLKTEDGTNPTIGVKTITSNGPLNGKYVSTSHNRGVNNMVSCWCGDGASGTADLDEYNNGHISGWRKCATYSVNGNADAATAVTDAGHGDVPVYKSPYPFVNTAGFGPDKPHYSLPLTQWQHALDATNGLGWCVHQAQYVCTV